MTNHREQQDRIEVDKLSNLICKEEDHIYVIDIEGREITCKKCGKGKRIQLSEIKELDGNLFYKGFPLDLT